MAINRNKVLANARKYVHKGNWEKAIGQYQQLVDDDPRDARSMLKIADLYSKLNRRDDALKAYRKVADHYATDEIYEKAAAVYKQALRLAPDAADLHRDLGDAYHRLGRLKDAVREYHRAQKIYKAGGDTARQRELLERMIELDADDIGMRIQLAERYAKDNMSERALELFEFSADKLDAEGRVDEFVQVAERIIFLKGEALELRRRVIDIYLNRGDHRSALSHLQVCFKRQPQDLQILDLLAQAFVRLERTDKAVLVLHELANQHRVQSHADQAARTYERILGLDPGNAQAQSRLRSLRRKSDSGAMTAAHHDTGALKTRNHTPAPPLPVAEAPVEADALAGIEFLDEDSEVKVEVYRAEQPPTPEQRPRHAPPPVTIDQQVSVNDDLELLDVIEPTVEHASTVDSDVVARVMKETDVFIKYGLHDKAYESIVGVIAQHPDSLRAHAQMARLQQARNNPEGAVDEFLEMARITRATPSRSYDFIQQAMALTHDRARVTREAEALGVVLDTDTAPAPSAHSEEDLLFLDLDDYPAERDSASPGDAGDLALDDDDYDLGDAGHTDRIEISDELLALKLSDLEEIDQQTTAGVQAQTEPGTQELELDDDDLVFAEDLAISFVEEDVSLEDVSIDDLDFDADDLEDADFEIGDFDDDDFDGAGFAEAGVDELNFDESAFEGADLVEMEVNLEGIDELSDAQLSVLSDEQPRAGQLAPNFDLSEEEADQMFDDLFGDFEAGAAASPSDASVNLGKDDPQGELAEIDFFLQQGLVSEAQEILEQARASHPAHPGLDKRSGQIDLARHGLQVNDNPFGARSLSQKFVPAAEFDVSQSPLPGQVDAHNTSLELGIAYRDMGLHDEAILEFTQALDDPDAAAAAAFHIALCEIDKGQTPAAARRLEDLLQKGDLPGPIRQAARQQLEEIL